MKAVQPNRQFCRGSFSNASWFSGELVYMGQTQYYFKCSPFVKGIPPTDRAVVSLKDAF